MKQVFALPLVVGGIVSGLLGCSCVSVPQYLDDYFIEHGTAVEHNEIVASAELKDKKQKTEAIAALKCYLEEQPSALPTKVDDQPLASPIAAARIRARDYWASLLAQLTNTPLHLRTRVSEVERDREIQELLKTLSRE